MKTFVVRLFVARDPESRPPGAILHGLVEDVASGRQVTFASEQQLFTFLAAEVERGAELSGGSS